MRKFFIYSLLVSMVSVPGLFAQGVAEKRQNAKYYSVGFTKFKKGKMERGIEIIQKYYWPVDQKIGRNVMPFDFMTGEWDHIVFFALEDGMSELDWKQSPSNAKWWNGLVKELGSEEKVKEIMTEFDSCVLKSKTEIAYTQYQK